MSNTTQHSSSQHTLLNNDSHTQFPAESTPKESKVIAVTRTHGRQSQKAPARERSLITPRSTQNPMAGALCPQTCWGSAGLACIPCCTQKLLLEPKSQFLGCSAYRPAKAWHPRHSIPQAQKAQHLLSAQGLTSSHRVLSHSASSVWIAKWQENQ
jgi:hypothetical protein